MTTSLLCSVWSHVHDCASLTQWFHIFKWVHSRWENEKHRRRWTTFFKRFGKFRLSALCIRHPKFLFHKVPTVHQNERRTQGFSYLKNNISCACCVISLYKFVNKMEYNIWNIWRRKKNSSPESVGHTVWSQSSHHDQFLQGTFTFPLLWKLLLLWTLRLNEFLPAFGWTFNIPVQAAELIGKTHHLGHKQEANGNDGKCHSHTASTNKSVCVNLDGTPCWVGEKVQWADVAVVNVET